ncbi:MULTISPECIES: hypothetical protein [unclassified Campylobacter]|uniref:hypothetical protein n=1 Tax=unclassified Campylobacter TaxID=2593542 RepID=UPI0022E9F56A|nr:MULTISPECIES: hypothetical protein [unclassified Campylobacter]MDA3086586.1 hypothetical protein [Campylobacter sp. CN_NA2]MDA3088351.1 hypothetical protein [Campylobacter sp. CN_EL1]MDA3056213.1 hypothetical protein [Campylobacter sp. CN_NA1]MDA3065358.1 hypothetical protein [Campylobacter sp. CN_NE4]MDA3068184.1 hypothetical protein [Campylobacter sp. CN_NE3]
MENWKIKLFIIGTYILIASCYVFYKNYNIANEREQDRQDREYFYNHNATFEEITENGKVSVKELVEQNLRDHLQKLYKLDNFSEDEIKTMRHIRGDWKLRNTYSDYQDCTLYNSSKTNCRFWKIDKNLNLEKLMNIVSKICDNNGSVKANYEEILESNPLPKKELFDPFAQKDLIDENGDFIENFIYIKPFFYKGFQIDFFTNYAFIEKRNKRYYVLIPQNPHFTVFASELLDDRIDFGRVCRHYKNIYDKSIDELEEFYYFKKIAIHDKSYTAKIADYERFSEARYSSEFDFEISTKWKEKINKIKNLENKLQYKGENDEF